MQGRLVSWYVGAFGHEVCQEHQNLSFALQPPEQLNAEANGLFVSLGEAHMHSESTARQLEHGVLAIDMSQRTCAGRQQCVQHARDYDESNDARKNDNEGHTRAVNRTFLL